MTVQVTEVPQAGAQSTSSINIMPALAPAAAPQTAQEQQVKKDLGLLSSQELTAGQTVVDPVLDRTAQSWADKLLHCDQNDAEQSKNARGAVETLGLPVQEQLAKKSDMLKQQITVLAQSAESSGIAKSLIDLKIQVDTLNPHLHLGQAGFIGRLAQHVPGVGTPLNRYFTKWQSSGAVIDSIVIQLREGAKQLVRDIDVLTGDQAEMRALTLREQKMIQTALLLDQKLSTGIDGMSDNPERQKFLQEEVLYPLRQRIQDLQQSLLVNQQGVISYEIIIRNNRELVRSAKRCQDVTVRALETAVVIALALNNQRIVLKTIQAIDEVTASLLVQNSIALHQQGVEIHKQASSQSIAVEALKQSFTELIAAMDDVERFKQEALPQMKQRILEMNQLSGEANKAIEKMEKGNRSRPAIALDLETTGPANK